MSKELYFTDGNNEVKYLDTTASFNLAITQDGSAFDLTNAKTIDVKVANDTGYVFDKQIDMATIKQPLAGLITMPVDAEVMNALVPDDYTIEVWVTLSSLVTPGSQEGLTDGPTSVTTTGTTTYNAIFPSDDPQGFTITENVMSDSGDVIPVMSLDEFQQEFNQLKTDLTNKVSTLKGQKGDTGQGLEIKGKVDTTSQLPKTASEGDGYLVAEELYIWTNNAWKDCGTLRGPQGIQGLKGDTGSGLVVKGTVNNASQLPTAGNKEGYCYFVGTDLYVWVNGAWKNCGNISPDLKNYVTVTDLNNGLSTKVNVTDMRKPASDVAGIEEVNAKQDKIGYTPADDSKVVHNSAIDPSVMFKRTLTADDDVLALDAGIYCAWGVSPKNYPTSVSNFARVVVKKFSGLDVSTGNIIVEVLDAFNNKMLNIYQGGPPTWSGWKAPNSGTMATKSDVSTATANKADDSKVAHLSGANNFDTVPTVNNNPLLLASSLPSDLARTGEDANFTGKLQQNGIDVATKSDVTTAVSSATANMVDSTKATNFTAGLKVKGVDVATNSDTGWKPLVSKDSSSAAFSSSSYYRIVNNILYIHGTISVIRTSEYHYQLWDIPTGWRIGDEAGTQTIYPAETSYNNYVQLNSTGLLVYEDKTGHSTDFRFVTPVDKV